jgi:hypothetical protein
MHGLGDCGRHRHCLLHEELGHEGVAAFACVGDAAIPDGLSERAHFVDEVQLGRNEVDRWTNEDEPGEELRVGIELHAHALTAERA